MAVRGQTGTIASLDLKTSVEIKPLELSVIPSGKLAITLPGLRIRISEIGIGLLFLPLLRLGSMELTTEPARLEVNLTGTTIQTQIERVTQVQVITSGEIRANASLEGTGAATAGPLRLEA
jgi:hypothetical protein